LAAVLLLGLGGSAIAHETSSDIAIPLENGGWDGEAGGNDVLLIETISTALGAALTSLSVPYDLYQGQDFSGLDLSPYTHVFLAMDGGLVENPSIQNLANFANDGGCAHIYGGTCYQPYAIALNTHLLLNNINDYCWTTVNGLPHSTVVDNAHYLAQGLPATYTFVDIAASYYQTRSTDGAAAVAAENGDGYDHVMSKAIGNGSVDLCINSPSEVYYQNGSDFDWLTQVVSNMLDCGAAPTATESATWGGIKAIYR
jgi:hypothetical protein